MVNRLRKKQGMTLLEMLTVVAVLCVILTIAVPSLWAIGRTLEFQKRNNYARSIFLAAQRELVELRSSGQLDMLALDPGAVRQMDDAEGTPAAGYVYTHSGAGTFDRILPLGAVEETLREQQILIEYHPESGSVYGVFYYEGSKDLSAQYAAGRLTREEASRKEQMLGYYGGSGLTDPELGIYHVKAELGFINGQEGIVTVTIPTQATVDGETINFMDDYNAFGSGLEVTLTVSGEQGGTFTKVIKSYGDTENCESVPGEGGVRAMEVRCTLDSLLDKGNFASLPENDKTPEGMPEARTLTDIREGDYVIAPGDNVSIAAEVTFRPGLEDPLVIIESGALAGVNPMFASLTPGTQGDILAISNGRHLQNLNALAPEIARNVEAVAFFPGQTGKGGEERIIDWKDTVDYYHDRYGTGDAQYNSEVPARRLPYFVPIQNPYLFGTAEFLQPEGSAPRLQEVHLRGSKPNARILGNNVKICNLYIESGKYTSATDFYGVSETAVQQRLTGLLGYANTKIDGISLVNPVIRGLQPRYSHAAASGALVGAAGTDCRISRCGVYIDTGAADFVSENLNMTDFTGEDAQYGVSGGGAVGGLVGYIESNQDNTWAVSNCFAAVPVFGKMDTGDFCGYRNGVGGLVGNAQMTGFVGCYASGAVRARGCTLLTGVAENGAHIRAYGAESTGAGGFAGTSHGCRYADCFAGGNVRGTDNTVGSFVGVLCWDSILGGRKTKLSGCYGAGTVYDGKNRSNFAGTAAIINPMELPDGLEMQCCYYLSAYGKGQEASPYGTPVTFEALGSTATAGLTGWSMAAETYAYGEGGAYPFLLPAGLKSYYGLWPEPRGTMAAAYYEEYGTDSPQRGYYVDSWEYDTLQDAPVTQDGYVILSASSRVTAKVGETQLQLRRDTGSVTLGGNAYYVFHLPLDALAAAAGEGFYAKVELESQIWQDGTWQSGESCTVYVNPDVAMGQVSTEGKMPSVPDTVQIRSARQLTALAGGHMRQFLHLTFVQKTDISLPGSDNLPIEVFSGTYDGGGKYISGLTNSLFADNAGTIRNLQLQTRDAGNLAECNSGRITDCTVTGSGTLSVPGLVTVNQGIIRDCTVDAAVLADGSAPAGILVGRMQGGSIRDCSVSGSVDGASNAVVGGVVGCVQSGEITGVASCAIVRGEGQTGTFAGAVEAGSFTDCHTTGENSRYPFAGFAAVMSLDGVHGDATHYTWERWPDGIITRENAEAFRPLTELPGKPAYMATFENCTFLLNGEETQAIGRQYCYRLEPLEGWELEAMAPNTAAIAPGEYVLISEERALHFTEGGNLEWLPKTEILDGMRWYFDGEDWRMEKTAVVKTEKEESGAEKAHIGTVTEYTISASVTTRSADGGSLAVTVDYTITAAITETRTVGTEAPVIRTETKTAAQGSEACFLYKVAANSDYAATCVDTRDVLVMAERKP